MVPRLRPLCLNVVALRPVKVLKSVGKLQAREEEHRLQELLQSFQSLHAAAGHAAGLDHLVDVLGEPLTHLRDDITVTTCDTAPTIISAHNKKHQSRISSEYYVSLTQPATLLHEVYVVSCRSVDVSMFNSRVWL